MSQLLHGDCLDVLKLLPDSSANLIVTSPPYAMRRKASYGGIEPDKYVPWFLERAEEFMRILTPDGSMILNICPHVENGVVSPYVNELINVLSDFWFWKATYWWRKPSCLPGKVTVRLRNAVEPLYHFSIQQKPALYPEQVLQPPGEKSLERGQRVKDRDYEARISTSGSGFSTNVSRICERYVNGGAVLPDNVIEASPEVRRLQLLYGDPKYDNDPKASAPFPEAIPAFFINLMTRRGDTVLDPFAGSGTTAVVAQQLCRNFIAIDTEEANVALMRNRLQHKKRRIVRLGQPLLSPKPTGQFRTKR